MSVSAPGVGSAWDKLREKYLGAARKDDDSDSDSDDDDDDYLDSSDK